MKRKRPKYGNSKVEYNGITFDSRQQKIISHGKKKYNNKKVEIDGILFDSNLEGKVYIALKDMQGRGLISQLETHPRWELQPKLTESYIKHLKTKDKVCERTILQPIYYTADFSFIQDDKLRVIDVKGSKYVISKDFPLRVKILRFKYGIDVHVVYNLKDLSIYKPIEPIE